MTSEATSNNNMAMMMSNGYNAATALQIRLETDNLLTKVECFLKGKQLIAEVKDGQTVVKEVKVGEPLANQKGIQALMNFTTSIINPQVVQGNFDEERFENYVYQVHINLATQVINNCYNWEILDNNLDPVMDFIMNLVEPFISRLIDNKERDSYASTIKSIESNTMATKGGFSLGNFGGNK